MSTKPNSELAETAAHIAQELQKSAAVFSRLADEAKKHGVNVKLASFMGKNGTLDRLQGTTKNIDRILDRLTVETIRKAVTTNRKKKKA